jgi:hypothetical protein
VVSVTTEQVAALRAQLAGDMEEHNRLLKQLRERDDGIGYHMLLTAAFYGAARRRFGRDWKAADVILFVAGVRARAETIAGALEPRIAERVLSSVLSSNDIAAALTDTEIDDLNTGQVTDAETHLLMAMIADERLRRSTLDKFLAEARTRADRVLAALPD